MSGNSITNSHTVVKSPLLEDNLGVVWKVAWEFASRYNLDVDDLYQEACLACVRALPKYNPTKGAITTFLWYTSTNRLKDLLDKNATFQKHHVITDHFSGSFVADEHAAAADDVFLTEYEFRELWGRLSPEAQEICRMVISTENLYCQTEAGNFRRRAYLPTDKPRRCRGVIRQILEQQGWAKSRIQAAFREIRSVLGT